MKYYLLLFLLFNLCLHGKILSQEYDTLYHSSAKHTMLNFNLSDENATTFKVSKINITTIENDTTEHKVQIDTFFLKRTFDEPNEIIYDYWFNKHNWMKMMIGKKCQAFENRITTIPIFRLKWSRDQQAFEFNNCEENIPVIHETLSVGLACLETQEDQSLKKYLLDDFENVKDCSRQTLLFLQDLGHVTSLINFPIPSSLDSTIYFSIYDKKDTTGLLNIHFYTKKIVNPSGTIIQIGEDLKRSESTSTKFTNEAYNIFKNWLTPEEQKRDSIRMLSIKEAEVTTIEIDPNEFFKKYQRYNYRSMLNVKMKPRKTEYWHIIEKL